MASMQKSREERAETAAQKAADELAAARRDHPPAVHEASSPGRRGGIFGSVQESARSLLGAVRDTFSGSGGGGIRDTATATHDSTAAGAAETAGDKLGEDRDYAAGKAEEGKDKAREMADAAAGKAAETKDAAAEKARGAGETVAPEEGKEKAREMADESLGKAAETKDAAAEKARGAGETVADKAWGAKDATWETKDTAAEKARGAGETVTDKARGAKDAAWDKAEGAREYVVDKEEDARQALAGAAKESKGETNESAWQQGQDVRRREHQPSEEEKGRSATENIYGAAQGLTEAFKEKMTMPTDVVEQKLAEARGGGGGRMGKPTAAGRGEAHDEDDVMMRVKTADQMTGTAFNDVGMMGEEGTGMKAALRADEDEDVMMRVKAADHMTGQGFNDVGMMGEEGTGMEPASSARAAGKGA